MNKKNFHWGFIFAPLCALLGLTDLFLGRSRQSRLDQFIGVLWLVLAGLWALVAGEDLRMEEEEAVIPEEM